MLPLLLRYHKKTCNIDVKSICWIQMGFMGYYSPAFAHNKKSHLIDISVEKGKMIKFLTKWNSRVNIMKGIIYKKERTQQSNDELV